MSWDDGRGPERRVVLVRLGAGLLIALAAGASVAGWWLPVAVVVAGSLALLVPKTPTPGDRGAKPRVVAAVAARLTRVPVFAWAFAAYLAPGHEALAAVVLIVAATVADVAGLRVTGTGRRWVGVPLVLAGAVLVALCVAIPPAGGTVAGSAPGVAGTALAVLLVLPLLTPEDGSRSRRGVAGAVVVALAVAVAALHQLGPTRLGLSVTSMWQLLDAVDARELRPALAALVVLATVPATVAAVSSARAAVTGDDGTRKPTVSIGCGLAGAVLAVVLGPVPALLLAGIAAAVELLVSVVLRAGAARAAGT
jgi:hypothetical protein